MAVEKIDAALLSQMVLTGAYHLSNNAQKIDALNVFPVPDGDTGTNMNLTITSGANEVKKLETDNVSEVTNAFAKGLLMGARGNSGVILSQIFRGFAKACEGKKELNVKDLAGAFEGAVNAAYKAVMKPVEGTILTVAKDAGNKAVEISNNDLDIITFMEEILKESKASLKRTPDLLPVLKEVGVVDSGGQGLVTIYEGFLAALKGEEVPEESDAANKMEEMVNVEHHKVTQDFMETEDIVYGYCTEFMVKLEDEKLKAHPFDETTFRNELSEWGDSLLVVADEEIVKVHVHAESPGTCLNLAQQYGSLINLKIENMREQHTAIVGNKKEAPKEKSVYGMVTVAMGSGLKELFENLGVAVVIEGGQTMNPSTQDITNAIEKANAENIIVLPNNKNIQMAAEQAANLAGDHVRVVPTKTIPQGISAMLAFHPEASLDDNKTAMEEAGKQVRSGQITYAVRDTQIDGIDIAKGHFMGIDEGKIVTTHKEKQKAAEDLIDKMISDDSEILTILSGEDVSEEEVEALESYVEEKYDEIEVEIHQGEQPIYSYIFSVE
ncbi:DAK2 domain-containing protein [Oceanobacillus jeddahense]|uniref:DAK2 domain-containing protein n=1 Tax=Oceanobacillus jeddahense TaxID=1462527 RepID=A0ABY5JP36_9BACI|nr:DAK2 domain-containing protein [Oceanobacillus jeddahense]UUI01579.1 DAK2 domain-containing protein [Oceanobacillus jeddahense]